MRNVSILWNICVFSQRDDPRRRCGDMINNVVMAVALKSRMAVYVTLRYGNIYIYIYIYI